MLISLCSLQNAAESCVRQREDRTELVSLIQFYLIFFACHTLRAFWALYYLYLSLNDMKGDQARAYFQVY